MTYHLPILSCDSCGACCRETAFPLYTALELFGIPESLRKWWLGYVSKFKGDPRTGPCCAFDLKTKRCRIYENRPAICVNFERGGPHCVESRKREGID